MVAAGLSKGQQRVLHFLMANRVSQKPDQTQPIGYAVISKHCFLSRSGSRKVMDELCAKGLIKRIETVRGETQGTVYRLESSIRYATESDMHDNSSSKELLQELLQELLFEDAFQTLNPRSLMPFLEQFDTTADVQDFLDIANACITAAKEGHGKPIKNPHGFLFAQLRQGYINPPEGYKSRRVRAQEIKNQQLEAEIAALQQLKAQEDELHFELFKAKLTEEDLTRLEEEARKQINRKIGLSTERQIEVNKEDILKRRFEQRKEP